MKQEVRKAYENVTMPAEDKERIYLRITSQAGKGHRAALHRFMKAAMVAFCVLATTGTVYAVSRLLTAREVVSELDGSPKLVGKFDSFDPSVSETKEDGKYRVTYLGMVTGANLSKEGLEADKKKSYYVVAVERKDGKKISMENPIVVSPFVKGEAPWHCNIYTLGGKKVSQIKKGVLYSLSECDSLEIFADRGVYLGVTDGAPNAESYQFDEKTGEISRNEKYDGLNLLFSVEIDPSKANPKEAEKYLEQFDKGKAEGNQKLRWYAKLSLEDVLSKGRLIAGSVKRVKPDKDGYYRYQSQGCSFTIADWGETCKKGRIGNAGSDEHMYTCIGERNKDDSITFMLYDITMLKE